MRTYSCVREMPSLPAALALQSAGATVERNSVATVTTTQDQKRLLMMWGAPKPGGSQPRMTGRRSAGSSAMSA